MQKPKISTRLLLLPLLLAMGQGSAHADYVVKVKVPELKVTAPTGGGTPGGNPGGNPGGTPGNGGSTTEPPTPAIGALQFSPTSLQFNPALIGVSTEQAVRVTNVGPGSVTVTGASMATGLSDFNFGNTCGSPLAAGGECWLTVAFTPAARGVRTGVLAVTGTDGLHTLSMDGTGLAPASLTLSTSDLSFQSSLVGVQSAESRQVIVGNEGDIPLVISSASITSGGAAYSATGCSSNVAPGLSCTLTVRFTPQAASNPGVLRIVSNASNAPSAEIVLSGGGLLPASLSLDKSSLTFAASGIGAKSAETLQVIVSNPGDSPLSISSASIVEGLTAYSATGCSGSVAAHGSCTVTVSFTPQASANPGKLRIVSNAPTNGTQDVTLTGTGSASPLITMTTANPSFASAPIGYKSTESKTVTLKNTGTASLTISSIAFAPTTTVYARTGNCTTLAANASCSFTLSFTPSATSNPATLRVLSTALNTPTLDIPVSGIGRNAGTLTITRAVYGLNVTIASSGNLTTKLAAVCNGKSQCQFDPFDVLGSDPSPNNPKNMELTYTCSSTGSTSYSYSAGAEAGLRQHTLTCP